jgi:type II secretory pathway predicted ATPase ExeA
MAVPGYDRLRRRFDMLVREPGLGVLTGLAGLGKTTGIRDLCSRLPRPDYRVVYLCDTAVSPLDLYRQLAVELGVTPSHRRAQLWQDLKAAMVNLVDEQGVQPMLVIDEAQHLGDRFLVDLSGFLNFAMDSRNVLILWLVGQPQLASILRMKRHAALASRVAARVRLEPLTDRKLFMAFLQQGLAAAGATGGVLSEPASELLFRASHGIPRRLAWLLREAMMLAHENDKSFIDDTMVEAVLDEEEL